MKKFQIVSFIFVSLLTITSLAAPTAALAKAGQGAGAQTYTVIVGGENVSKGIGVMSFFPETLKIHVGDTVLWKQNTHEIHTVTFLAGEAMPEVIVPIPGGQPGEVMINPHVAFPTVPQNGLYDGSTFANSGIMSTDPGQPQQFALTFTKEGTFTFVCVVHGMMMSGKIEVVGASEKTLSPAAVANQAHQVMHLKLARANKLFGVATSQIPNPQKNADGTMTHFVLIGFSQGQVDLMSFFPKKLVVHPGDTVEFMLSDSNVAPHTVTFFNGEDDIPFIIPIPNPPGLPILKINPEVLGPINPGQLLTTSGVFSSGLLDPNPPFPKSYSWKIGNISGLLDYECILHDTSGMQGVLKVVP